jgi:hypothetical protein
MGIKQLEIILIPAVLIMSIIISPGCSSVQNRYLITVREEFTKQPLSKEKILTQSDIAGLPHPVQKYITYSGAIGKSIPQNFRLEFDAQMTKKPGDKPMDASSEQVNFLENYSRIFFMKASKFLVPFRILHVYEEQKATFVVRVASLFNAVDLSGEQLTTAETVTILNDLCVFAPGSLIDKRLSWKEIDSLSSEVTFTNGVYIVSAMLYFNEKGELINFISNDRSALQDDGSLKKVPWITPLSNYKNFDGRMVSTTGATIYRYPEGDFTYGTFTLKSIRYNVKE